MNISYCSWIAAMYVTSADITLQWNKVEKKRVQGGRNFNSETVGSLSWSASWDLNEIPIPLSLKADHWNERDSSNGIVSSIYICFSNFSSKTSIGKSW